MFYELISVSLNYYLTIGAVKDNKIYFDIRYLGQSVGTLKMKNNKVLLSVTSNQSENNKSRFQCDLGEIKDKDWKQSKKAKEFRSFFKNDAIGTPRQKEHMVESALYSETEKTTSTGKSLLGIQPFKFANTRIHMKTALSASNAKIDTINFSKTGGEIDLLCRRNVKPTISRLVAIEIKDENRNDESFDDTIKQAIAYSVFLWALIRSDAGPYWLKIFGMEKQFDEKHIKDAIIEAVVAMPEKTTLIDKKNNNIKVSSTSPTFDGDIISVDGNKIALHYMKIDYDPQAVENIGNKDKTELRTASFTSSFNNWQIKKH